MPRTAGRRSKVIGDISIYPIGKGTSLGEFVRVAYRAMGRVPGVRLVPTAMATVIEADDLATVLQAVERAHAALLRTGAQRIAVHVRIDHRLDKPETIEYKVDRMTGKGPKTDLGSRRNRPSR